MIAPERQRTGAAARGDREAAARAAKVRRSAWLMAGVALFIYVAYLLTLVVRNLT